MRQGLCNGTVSVCLSQLPTGAAACGGFAAVGAAPSGRRYQLPGSNGAVAAQRTAARWSAANAGSITFTAAVESSTQTYIVSFL